NVTTSFNTMIMPGNMPYGQSKAALEAASASWAADSSGTGVTVNILVPGGAADTALVPHDAPFDRAKMVKPDVMVAPIVWLMSKLSDGTSGTRFVAKHWDPKEPWQEAMQLSSAPIAWPDLAAAASAGQYRREESATR
ncbi:MAG: SDR family oxidoreductase, partial [Hyphomicrobium sp.]